ncbi:MAG: nucleotidyltransferase domain-containing protein, partial [Sphingobacteriales bacterium]
MNNMILDRLRNIEEQHKVRILYACESGSRAWGFPSADSDYDVRFIYTHPLDHYLSIDEYRDVIEIPVNEVLDINGWDIRKALRLFRKSNAPLYEWLQSPIIYSQEDQFAAEVKSMLRDYFCLRAGMHHYLSMAYNAFDELQAAQVRAKKYFYCLRPLLATIWIAEKQQLPPMEFRLLRTLVDDAAWHQAIDELLSLKRHGDEKLLVN